MISKQLLKKRLGLAIGKTISDKRFSDFFDCFCRKYNRPALKKRRKLTDEEADAFSRYCGYDLRFPIPLPFM